MNKEQKKDCACTSAGLFIPNRQVSFIVVGLVIIFTLVFISAYFLGKQQAYNTAQPFVDEQCDMCDLTHEEFAHAQSDEAEKTPLFYGELIGFGTKKAAHNYAQKLLQQSYAVHVKERVGKTAKGRSVHWYQVITEPSDYHHISTLVEKISKDEHLADAKVVALHTPHKEGILV